MPTTQDPSDAILYSESLTQKDRKLVEKLFDLNIKKFKKEFKSSNIFKDTERNEFMKKIDFGIKAILQHEINKRSMQ